SRVPGCSGNHADFGQIDLVRYDLKGALANGADIELPGVDGQYDLLLFSARPGCEGNLRKVPWPDAVPQKVPKGKQVAARGARVDGDPSLAPDVVEVPHRVVVGPANDLPPEELITIRLYHPGESLRSVLGGDLDVDERIG